MSSPVVPPRILPRPPGRLAEQARAQKQQELAWFHLITSGLDETEIRQACRDLGLGHEQASLHDLQTLLLQVTGTIRRQWLAEREQRLRQDAQVPQKVR